MASSAQFVDFITGQLAGVGNVTVKKMFGEYGLYSGGKMFGLVCDDRLFIKTTTSGKNFAGNVAEAAPYPGAKPIMLIEDQLEDGNWLCKLVRITVAELPEPKPKKRK